MSSWASRRCPFRRWTPQPCLQRLWVGSRPRGASPASRCLPPPPPAHTHTHTARILHTRTPLLALPPPLCSGPVSSSVLLGLRACHQSHRKRQHRCPDSLRASRRTRPRRATQPRRPCRHARRVWPAKLSMCGSRARAQVRRTPSARPRRHSFSASAQFVRRPRPRLSGPPGCRSRNR